MTTRDRLFGLCLVAAAILAAMWFLLVSPERAKISGLNAEVSSAQQALTAAQSKLAAARTSQASYQTDYASIVKLGEAVPPTPQVPSLVYELDQLSNSKDVDFASITSSGGSSSTAAAATTATTGFTELPFTFTFNGSFFDLYKLLNKLNGLAVQTSGGGVQITGRLLTIQSANLTASAATAPASTTDKTTSAKTKTSLSGKSELTGTITATAYVLPAAQGLTAGATPAGPAGVTATPQPASTPAATTSPTPTASIKVTP
jgi:Tfp pilus assembly protein PilO